MASIETNLICLAEASTIWKLSHFLWKLYFHPYRVWSVDGASSALAFNFNFKTFREAFLRHLCLKYQTILTKASEMISSLRNILSISFLHQRSFITFKSISLPFFHKEQRFCFVNELYPSQFSDIEYEYVTLSLLWQHITFGCRIWDAYFVCS